MHFRPWMTRLRRNLFGKQKIWLVDDEKRWHDYVFSTYGSVPDFETQTFYSPNEVVKALDDGYRPDLLLIDILREKRCEPVRGAIR